MDLHGFHCLRKLQSLYVQNPPVSRDAGSAFGPDPQPLTAAAAASPSTVIVILLPPVRSSNVTQHILSACFPLIVMSFTKTAVPLGAVALSEVLSKPTTLIVVAVLKRLLVNVYCDTSGEPIRNCLVETTG